jgi:hypothetical protein
MPVPTCFGNVKPPVGSFGYLGTQRAMLPFHVNSYEGVQWINIYLLSFISVTSQNILNITFIFMTGAEVSAK